MVTKKSGYGIAAVLLLLIVISSITVISKNPGHIASSISPEFFSVGNYSINGNFSIGDNTVIFFADNSTGNIGIGARYPRSQIHVSGTGHMFNVSSGNNALIYVNGTEGYVGINTSTPQYTLDINGNLRVQNTLILPSLPNSSSTTEGAIYYDTEEKQLKVYANGRFDSDNTVSTRIVAANNSKNREKADFVADGLGGTDDTATIKAAIDSLPAKGGSVYLLDGTFYLESSVRINRSNFSLVGVGKATVLKRMWNETTANNAGVLTLGDFNSPYSGILISQLSIDGDNKTNTNSNNHGILLNGSITYSTIKNTWVHDSGGTGIYAWSAWNQQNKYNTVVDNEVYNNNNDGIHIDGNQNSQYFIITGNKIYQNGGGSAGLFLNGGGYHTVTGNYIAANGITGVRINNAPSISFSGNIIVDNYQSAGILDFGSQYHSLTGNIISNNGLTGLNMWVSYSTITGNVFSGNGGTGSSNSLYVGGPGGSGGIYNVISSNSITDTAGTGYAIEVSGNTQTNNYLYGNAYFGTGATSILDGGSQTLFGGQLSGNNMIFVPQGLIGIGTVTPTAKLHLNVTNDTGAGAGNSKRPRSDALFITNSTGEVYVLINGTTGFIGIGTSMPTHTLNIKGTFNATGNNSIEGGLIVDSAGKVGINNSAPFQTLHVNGSIAVCSFADTGCPTTITAGQSYSTSRSGGAIDIAEWIKFKGEKPKPGDVVCAAEGESPGGTVELCSSNTSNKAIGVVSTKPHMTIGQEYKGEDAVRIAITGRIPVSLTGDAKPGDLLAASENGKATACNNGCQGSIVGKAISKSREGKVMALLTLN